ncbi:MAG: cyclic nucleotide-binding domain-containing protein [Acidimicrobiia bacterium]
MRIESSVTSISWIPSEAVTGANKVVFEAGVAHYDEPPPDVIDDLETLRAADRFRFANHLTAWIEVENTKIVDYGYSGHGYMGSTTVRVGKREATYAAVELPELQGEPEETGTSVRFVQSVGGRTALPAPRRVNRPPFVQFKAPTVWTTLALTISADGTVHREMEGASPFPRHWVYDDQGKLEAKAGLADFKDWYRHAFGKNTPWGDEDSKVLVTTVETALERELSRTIMRSGAEPGIRKVKKGKTLTVQGEPGTEVYLLLDGVLAAEVDGEPVAEIGPGAILGERAVLEGGRRTSTLRALTKCKVAVASEDQLDRDALTEVSTGHRREEQPGR